LNPNYGMPYHKLIQENEDDKKIFRMQSIQIGNLMLCTLKDGTVKLIKNPFELKFVRETENLKLDYKPDIVVVTRTGWLICSTNEYKG